MLFQEILKKKKKVNKESIQIYFLKLSKYNKGLWETDNRYYIQKDKINSSCKTKEISLNYQTSDRHRNIGRKKKD